MDLILNDYVIHVKNTHTKKIKQDEKLSHTPHIYNIEWNKVDTKECIQYDSIDIKLKKQA